MPLVILFAVLFFSPPHVYVLTQNEGSFFQENLNHPQETILQDNNNGMKNQTNITFGVGVCA